ncbi:MAG TPA: hypothetical protein VLH40_06870 [Atribacteraceae bacterium]|nr:hypothetical protein [Atribacteraceae bacterium]
MQTVLELQRLGFRLWLDGTNIKYEHRGTAKPDAATIKPLVAELKANKAEAVKYLSVEDGERQLASHGWCAMASGVLGETVILVRDEGVLVPDRYRDAVRYTLDELTTLTTSPKVSVEGLRWIHEVKKVFTGATVSKGGT